MSAESLCSINTYIGWAQRQNTDNHCVARPYYAISPNVCGFIELSRILASAERCHHITTAIRGRKFPDSCGSRTAVAVIASGLPLPAHALDKRQFSRRSSLQRTCVTPSGSSLTALSPASRSGCYARFPDEVRLRKGGLI